ncbi:MAG: DEAD/DEAH box helicase [Tannerella sp.]|jgi:superfamily II DNA or RNA helicase|nr:DEAD/DEAH box helicase [Tannerella sp.]
MTNEILILTLSRHLIFGWKFNIYSAQSIPDNEDNERLQILGVPDAGQEERQGVPAGMVRLIRLVDEISDRALMKDYSKKKSTVGLKDEMTKEILERYVRPRIETVNCKIVELALQTGIPVFFRADLSAHILYERSRIRIVPSQTTCLFNFVKDADGLRYFITLTNGEQPVSLKSKPSATISEKPSIILIGKEIHCVENIESKKLTPFFEKKYVSVPAQSEEVYLKNFVFKTMQEYEVNIQGIPVGETMPAKQAFLSLERDFYRELVLILSFQYGSDPRSYPGSRRKKIVKLEEEADGSPAIHWYKRDTDWETRLINRLQEEGLRLKGERHFYPANPTDSCLLLEWLNRKEPILRRDFKIEQALEKVYFTGAVSLHTTLDVKADWFDICMVVAIGDYRIPFNRFRKHILAGKNEYLLPDQTVFLIPNEWFEKYNELFLNSEAHKENIRLKKIHALTLENAFEGNVPDQMYEQVRNVLQIPAERPSLPPLSRALLRPYQKEGFYWLEHLYRNGFGGCLADDMGLGKTLQTITLLQYVYGHSETSQAVEDDGQLSLFASTVPSALPASLVVVPTSLLHNWKNELTRFAPELKTMIYAGNKRLRTKDIGKIFNHYQVVITSYGTMRNDISCLCRYSFQVLVLDESQYIKNPESLSCRAAKQLVSRHKLVLTGTPIENSLEDLWAQFDFINEGLLGNFTSFKKKFIQPIVKEKDSRQEMRLKKIISPFLLRRTKEEVTPELPPLLQEVIYCDMTEAQQIVYNKEKNCIRNVFLEAEEHPEQKNNFIALEGLNRLRQLANHPKLIFPDYAEDAGKFEQIILSFESLKASNHKVLIFSSYVRHLKLLAGKFDEEGWEYAMLTGQTQRREEEIRRFTDNDRIQCFLISLKAGSTGLNLTAADYVFIVDPWWNPASEMQALSRAHRIGQDKTVIVYRFISSETIEEKIHHLQESKVALAETFINANDPFAHLNWDEIEELIS